MRKTTNYTFDTWIKTNSFLHGHEQKNGKILRFQHATSFSPQQQKNGVVIGEFCRVQRLTSDHNDLVEQSLLLAKEMNLLGITSKQLSTIFLRKYKNTNNSVWQLLHDLMKTEHKKLWLWHNLTPTGFVFIGLCVYRALNLLGGGNPLVKTRFVMVGGTWPQENDPQ